MNIYLTREVDGGLEIVKMANRDAPPFGKVVRIPRKINGRRVVSLGRNLFFQCKTISEVVVPEGVTNIGSTAFFHSSIRKVVLPSTIQRIGEFAFSANPRMNLVVAKGAKFRYDRKLKTVFTADGSELVCCLACGTEYVVPNEVRLIRAGAFGPLFSVRTIRIGPHLSEIEGTSPFSGSFALRRIEVDPANDSFRSIDGVLFFGREARALFFYPPGRTDRFYRVPNSTTRIIKDAFRGARIKEIAFGARVAVVEGNPFATAERLEKIEVDVRNATYRSDDGVLLDKERAAVVAYPRARRGRKYVVPSGTRIVGVDAFAGAKRLRRAVLPDSVRVVDERAFHESRVRTIVFPAGVSVLERSVCERCPNLSSAYLPDSIVEIGERAFAFCDRLRNLRVSKKVVAIREAAFCGASSLNAVSLPDTLVSLGSRAFEKTGRNAVKLPEFVEFLRDDAFDKDKPILVREGSLVHDWAFENDLNYRFCD